MFHFPGICGGGAVIQCTMYVVMIDRNTPKHVFPFAPASRWGLRVEEGISAEAFPFGKQESGVTLMNRGGAALTQLTRTRFYPPLMNNSSVVWLTDFLEGDSFILLLVYYVLYTPNIQIYSYFIYLSSINDLFPQFYLLMYIFFVFVAQKPHSNVLTVQSSVWLINLIRKPINNLH